MPERRQKSGAMLPLIIVGATLFAFGAYQSTKPKAPEVNTGFVAPPPANPATMQAPPAPPVEKDAARTAAQASDITQSAAGSPAKSGASSSVVKEEWFSALTLDSEQPFKGRILEALSLQQLGRAINCTPALSGMTEAAKVALEEVECTATDGTRLEARFKGADEGRLEVQAPDRTEITIRKNDGNYSVQTETNGR